MSHDASWLIKLPRHFCPGITDYFKHHLPGPVVAKGILPWQHRQACCHDDAAGQVGVSVPQMKVPLPLSESHVVWQCSPAPTACHPTCTASHWGTGLGERAIRGRGLPCVAISLLFYPRMCSCWLIFRSFWTHTVLLA